MLYRLLKLYERHVQALETFNALKGSELLAVNERIKMEQARFENDRKWWATWVNGEPVQRHELLMKADYSGEANELKKLLELLRVSLDGWRATEGFAVTNPDRPK